MRTLVGFGEPFGHLGSVPPARVSPFGGPVDTLQSMARMALGPRGEQSIVVRGFAEWVTRGVWPKDYLGEIVAVRNCLLQPSPWTGAPLFRYMNDPRHVELIKDPQRQVEEIREHGSTTVDCDEIATMAAAMLLQLGREVEFVALGYGGGKDFTHVAARAREPKSGRWIWIDPVAGPRERESAAKATRKMFHSLD